MHLLSLSPQTSGPLSRRMETERVQGRVREKSQKQDQYDGEMERDTVYTINVYGIHIRATQELSDVYWTQEAQSGRNSWTKGSADIGSRSSGEEAGTQRGALGDLSPPKGACLCLSRAGAHLSMSS